MKIFDIGTDSVALQCDALPEKKNRPVKMFPINVNLLTGGSNRKFLFKTLTVLGQAGGMLSHSATVDF